MSYKNIVISSGHGSIVRGASSILDEVDEARKVVEAVAEKLRARGAQVKTYHDNQSTSQSENLDRIIDFHNSQSRQLDISVHLNAFEYTLSERGTETLYLTQSTLAGQMSAAIANAGEFINRGPKKRTDLAFLNSTNMPSLLLEICFCDSQGDADLYEKNFEAICEGIAATLKHKEGEDVEIVPAPLLVLNGKCSWFGGKDDMGVSASEGLAWIYDVMDQPSLFLPYQPADTTGLARRLNDRVSYFAARFDYAVTPPDMLLSNVGLIRAEDGRELTALPADWGPHPDTNRILDVSPYVMQTLHLSTDDIVELIFPAPAP